MDALWVDRLSVQTAPNRWPRNQYSARKEISEVLIKIKLGQAVCIHLERVEGQPEITPDAKEYPRFVGGTSTSRMSRVFREIDVSRLSPESNGCFGNYVFRGASNHNSTLSLISRANAILLVVQARGMEISQEASSAY